MSMCVCGHSEGNHRGNGTCVAVIETVSGNTTFAGGLPTERIVCSCNDYRELPENDRAERIDRAEASGES